MNFCHRYDFENPQDDPDDEPNSDPFNHMADEHSYFEDDAYDRYEDDYMETGHDPYGLFNDTLDIPRVQRLLRAIKRMAGRLALLLIELRYGRNAVNVDDIPF